MSQQIPYNYQADKAIETLSKAAFLTTAAGGRVNSMTIGWGSIGVIWRRPVFTVLVRHSRYTYQLIEKSGEFTVSIPAGKDLQQALTLCGTKSGRDIDKIAAAGLTLKPGQKIATPVIAGGGLTYECKIIYKHSMTAEDLDDGVQKQCYADNDYHTIYFGEIVASYNEE
jgi:flavin reductase (DIM6/NTAB) family NADH-FMN oxidoreductase RutF